MTAVFTAPPVTPPHERGDRRFLPDRLILVMSRGGVMGRRCFRTRGSHNGASHDGSSGHPDGDRARGDPGSSARTCSGACPGRTGAGLCPGRALSGRQCLQWNCKRHKK